MACKPQSDGGPCKECLRRDIQCSLDRRSAGETDTDFSDLEESGKGERIRQWRVDHQMAAEELAEVAHEASVLLSANAELRASLQIGSQRLSRATPTSTSNDERAYAARIAREVLIMPKRWSRGENIADEPRKRNLEEK